jgi:hypothetical protein
MPASKHIRKADTPKRRRQWQHIREFAEERGLPPGRAIAMASGVLKRQAGKRRGKKQR